MKPRPRKVSGPIDWAEVRERIGRAQAAASTADALSPEQARAVLDERARLLARVPPPQPVPGEKLEVLAFALGRERYALETRHVREVLRLADYTPVPGAAEFVLGVTNLRGEILAVLDLRKLCNVPARGLSDHAHLIVLGAARPDFCVLADAAHEIRTVDRAELLAPPDAVHGTGRRYLLGVTAAALILLDGSALLADPHLHLAGGEPRDGAPAAVRTSSGSP